MDGMAPLFGFQGTLIGTTTVMPFGHDNVQTHIAIIDHLWSDLIAGHNVDKVRAYSTTDNEPPLPTSNGKHESTNGKLNAARIAKLTTVRLRPVEKSGGFGDEGWSGVVISPDGFVATCAHHMCVPGEQVTVHFSDGTAARGRILGSSRVTDIGLVKITDKSNLRFAKLGFSRTCAPGDRCFVSGYPTTSEQLAPMIIETAVVEPDGYVWSSILLTSADYETSPGFSGGGVFDTNGSLIAVHEGKNRGDVGRHRRSEFFRLQWKDLKSGRILGRPNGDDGAAH
jgi:S1-C subfamily serine protease